MTVAVPRDVVEVDRLTIVFVRIATQLKRPKCRVFARFVRNDLVNRTLQWIPRWRKFVRRCTTEPASTRLCMTIRAGDFDAIKIAEHQNLFANRLKRFERRTERKVAARIDGVPGGLDDAVGNVEETQTGWRRCRLSSFRRSPSLHRIEQRQRDRRASTS